jgi:hypothetical protein
VLDLLSILWLFGSFYGFFYPLVVGTTLALCAIATRRFRPRPRDWFPLATAPALTYYVLDYLVVQRQGWNVPYAVGALAAFGLLAVVASCLARRPAWLRAGTLAGVAVAFIVWRAVPYQGLTRLF